MTEENYAKGLIYPPFTNIRKISAHIAANVAAKAYELGKSSTAKWWFRYLSCFDPLIVENALIGLASRLPRPKDLVKFAESCMYTPVYRNYR